MAGIDSLLAPPRAERSGVDAPAPAQAVPPTAPPALPPFWPHRAHSHTVQAGGLHWHLQRFEPPAGTRARGCVLLLHGTGASGHSFAALAPLLAARHRVLVPDLPGHAFTQRPRADGLSLPGMAALLGALLRHLGEAPQLVLGHSAGAAIGAQLCLDGHAAPHTLAALNGAWFPPRGLGRAWFAPAARLLAANPLVPSFFAWQAARPATLQRLLDSTGSRLSQAQAACYAHLVADAGHVGGVLAMMAMWELPPLLHALQHLQPRLVQLVGERDRTVAPGEAFELARRLGRGGITVLPGLGHLAHEEAPEAVAHWVQSQALVAPRTKAGNPD